MSKGDTHPFTRSRVNTKDLVDYVLRRATSDQVGRVEVALKDPKSELNAWLKGLESWADDAFPKINDPETGRPVLDSKAMIHLNAVYEFAIRKRDDGILSDTEFSRICAAGELDGTARPPRKPAQAIAAAERMASLAKEMHPELTAEIDQLKPGRLR